MPITAADLLALYYGSQQPTAQRAGYAQGGSLKPEVTYGPFGERYEIQEWAPPTVMGVDPMSIVGQFGFRGRIPLSRGPWSAPEPRPAPRQAVQPGDNSIGQHVYETLLGRWRQPGEAVASQNSGSPYLSPLFWGGTAAGAYGSYRLWGLDQQPWPWEATPQERAEATSRENAHMDNINRGSDVDRLLRTYGPSIYNPDMEGSRGVPVLKESPY